jgi:hypothetical protein
MLEVNGYLPHKLQVTELALCAFISSWLESISKRLVIGKDYKGTAFNHMSEVFDDLVHCQKLAVVRTVLLLRGAKFKREESQGLPSIAHTLLQGGAN